MTVELNAAEERCQNDDGANAESEGNKFPKSFTVKELIERFNEVGFFFILEHLTILPAAQCSYIDGQ